jgi:hypothetical protein
VINRFETDGRPDQGVLDAVDCQVRTARIENEWSEVVSMRSKVASMAKNDAGQAVEQPAEPLVAGARDTVHSASIGPPPRCKGLTGDGTHQIAVGAQGDERSHRLLRASNPAR